MIMYDYTIRSPRLQDLERCYEIESTSYEGDEAATYEKIKTRILSYPEGFMVMEIGGLIVGFINSGSTDNVVMSDEHFKELIGHNPEGKHNVIMSVVVHRNFQGRGISSILIKNYIFRMRQLKKESIQLMCKENLISLYERFGFKHLVKSSSSHGGMSWHEMSLALKI